MRLAQAAAIVLVTALGGAAAAQAPTGDSASAVWTFDKAAAGGPPPGFSFGRTGEGRPGRWVVRAESDAPSAPHVLAQEDADRTDYRFPVAIAEGPALRDLRVSVRCKPVSGRVDEACGLIFRAKDENNYYITRANALENNVRLYYVKDGRRRQIASWKGKVTAGAWHELRAEAQGDRLRVHWDGQQVIDKRDRSFPDAGKVGLWTKADSVTQFDDLRAEPFGP